MARLMLSAPTNTLAMNIAEITTPIGDRPASMATTMPV